MFGAALRQGAPRACAAAAAAAAAASATAVGEADRSGDWAGNGNGNEGSSLVESCAGVPLHVSNLCRCEAAMEQAGGREPPGDKNIESLQQKQQQQQRRLPSPMSISLGRQMTLRRMQSIAAKESKDDIYDINPEPLGEGSYGEVFSATDLRSGEGVAVKIISKELTDDFEFQREMNALLHIRACGGHPNICMMRETFEEDDKFVLILDLIKGGEVFDYLIDNGAYSEMEAARLIREVASAISYLHGLGIVHADLKPENLMLSSKNKDEASIKVVDFGCAEILPELWTEGPPLDAGDGSAEDAVQQALLQPRRLIRPGRAGGTTSAYCPPEAFSNEEGAEISQAMDMWSLGVILYIMLTGLHPFDLDSTKTDEEIEDHIKTCRAPPLRGSPYTAHLSPSAIDLLSKLMAEDAKDRLTANEMLAHPWVRGVTARRDVMEASAEKLSKLRRFRSKFEAKVFANLINWSDDDRRHQYDHTTSLVQKAFMSVDEDRKGFVTENDVAKFLGHSVTDQEDAKSAEDASGKAMNLSGFSDMLSENMQSKFFPRGHTVFQEGDPGDYMYFINSGTVEVSTREGFRAKLGQGDSFGEGSLLRPDSRRSATIRCTTPVHAIAVDKVYFDRYMSQGDTLMALKLREKTNTRSFGRVEFVLSQQEGLEKREYDQGDIIFNIGDEADDLYVVDRGTVHIRGPKGNRLYAMNDGDLFGVQSVIMDRNRKASATCASEAGCSLRRMDYHQMNALLRQSPDLKRACHRMAFRREFRRAIVLRTRKSFPRASDLRRVFDSIDRDSSGDLDVDEVKELMKDLDKALSQEQIQELVKSMDLNGSGSINFEEFQSIFGRSVDK